MADAHRRCTPRVDRETRCRLSARRIRAVGPGSSARSLARRPCASEAYRRPVATTKRSSAQGNRKGQPAHRRAGPTRARPPSAACGRRSRGNRAMRSRSRRRPGESAALRPPARRPASSTAVIPGFRSKSYGLTAGTTRGGVLAQRRASQRSDSLCPRRLCQSSPLRIQDVRTALAGVDRLGDDFGLVAVDAAGGELLGAGERVEQAGSLPCACHGRNSPCRLVDSSCHPDI